jgi:hypothetical protein
VFIDGTCVSYLKALTPVVLSQPGYISTGFPENVVHSDVPANERI